MKGSRAALLLITIIKAEFVKIIYNTPSPYLMRTSFPLTHSSQNADQYLLELQSKLALKEAQKNTNELSSR